MNISPPARFFKPAQSINQSIDRMGQSYLQRDFAHLLCRGCPAAEAHYYMWGSHWVADIGSMCGILHVICTMYPYTPNWPYKHPCLPLFSVRKGKTRTRQSKFKRWSVTLRSSHHSVLILEKILLRAIWHSLLALHTRSYCMKSDILCAYPLRNIYTCV